MIESLAKQFKYSPAKQTILCETWILGAICTVDMVSTAVLVHYGKAVEANPILLPFIHRGLLAFIAVKSFTFVTPLAGLEIIRRHRPRFVKQMLRLGIAGYIGAYVLGGIHINRADTTSGVRSAVNNASVTTSPR